MKVYCMLKSTVDNVCLIPPKYICVSVTVHVRMVNMSSLKW